jgi:hypothetical protein
MEELYSSACPQNNCFMRASLLQNGKEAALTTGHSFPVYLKDGKISGNIQPTLEVTENTSLQSSDFSLSIHNLPGSVPALYVTLEATIPGYFSENAFHLVPGEQKSLKFVPVNKDHKLDISQVKVRSYNDMLTLV